MTISIGTSHTPSSRETNAAWLLRLREGCGRLTVEAGTGTGDGDPDVTAGTPARGVAEVLVNSAESGGR